MSPCLQSVLLSRVNKNSWRYQEIYIMKMHQEMKIEARVVSLPMEGDSGSGKSVQRE